MYVHVGGRAWIFNIPGGATESQLESEICGKNRRQKWAWPIAQDSTQFREHVDIGFFKLR